MTHRIRTILLDHGMALMVCAIAGCQILPLTTLSADELDRIVVNSGGGFQLEGFTKPPLTRIIDNRDQIAQIVAFLAAHNQGWHGPWDTPPNTVDLITFERDQHVVFQLNLGEDWMDTSSGGTYKIRRVGVQESKRIHELLGITSADE